MIGISKVDKITIRNPKNVKFKCCGTGGKRLQGRREISMNSSKKDGRTCTYCNKKIAPGEKHDRRNCPLRKEDERKNLVDTRTIYLCKKGEDGGGGTMGDRGGGGEDGKGGVGGGESGVPPVEQPCNRHCHYHMSRVCYHNLDAQTHLPFQVLHPHPPRYSGVYLLMLLNMRLVVTISWKIFSVVKQRYTCETTFNKSTAIQVLGINVSITTLLTFIPSSVSKTVEMHLKNYKIKI
ncbi:hypothetical protein LXL04_034264 [Taraxacum kok-saghyz]